MINSENNENKLYPNAIVNGVQQENLDIDLAIDEANAAAEEASPMIPAQRRLTTIN